MPIETTELLRAAGWICDTVPDEGLDGADDPTIGVVCQKEGRIRFTLDLDVADIRTHRRVSTSVSWCFDRRNPVDGTCFRCGPGFFQCCRRSGSTISSGLSNRIEFVCGAQPNQLSNSACTRRRCARGAPLVRVRPVDGRTFKEVREE